MLVPFNAVCHTPSSTNSFPINSKWNRIQMSFTSISIRNRSKHNHLHSYARGRIQYEIFLDLTQAERIKYFRRLYNLSNVIQWHAQGIYLRQKTPAGLNIFNSNPPTFVKWIKQKFLHRSKIISSFQLIKGRWLCQENLAQQTPGNSSSFWQWFLYRNRLWSSRVKFLYDNTKISEFVPSL
jgi:hypothetical protein